jgi:hypothetical protein
MAKVGQRGNGRGHITETPDVSHIKNVEVSHEVSDVNVSPILKFVAGLTVLIVVVFVLVLLLFDFLNHREVKKEPAPGPMAMSEQERLPPEPRLQSAPGFGLKLENGQWVNLQNREPQAEYRAIRNQWDRALKEGVKDQSGNIVALPIEQAMKKVLEGKGLPSRPKLQSEERPDWRPEDYGIYMPTAASSGRMTERGKQ